MFSFSLISLISTFIDFLNKPKCHIANGAYVIFSMNDLKLRSDHAHWLNALNCSCFAVTISLLAVHFVYRYISVCKSHKRSLFSFPYSLIWLIFCSTITVVWYTATQLYSSRTPELDQLINSSLFQNYEIFPRDIIYHGSYYYNLLDSKLNVHNTLMTFGVNLITLFCPMIILVCGSITYRELIIRKNISRKFEDLQRQLFQALVIQTIIPLFTMFLPGFLILILPIFRLTLGSSEFLLMLFITTYPLIDPLIVLYIIKDYRQIIKRLLKCNKNNQVMQNSSIIVSNNL
ncbi:unnamed protein product [Caenorhabditis angaria]|uniref:Seven TM Receptor n=1 Tax=Caenorhabditis angaria TaxID=860376 RepID=A0A9P1IZE0_9PELO|nr:unnamed protein product [Caenorhabditis angaria]